MGSGRKFDGNEWYKKNMDSRTRVALEAGNAAFEESYRDASDEELLEVIRARAGELGYAPQKEEVIGSSLICRRFGTWKNALLKAGYISPQGPCVITETDLYRTEYARQEQLYKAERDEKRANRSEKARLRQERDAARRRAKLAAGGGTAK